MAANERGSRSLALEQTYVHDVYEQYYDNPRSKPWPKVQQFMEKLEPGALVCDVGCGHGKYLKVNMSIFTIGGEKSIRLSDLARQNQNEVIKLDNLALPFKDNCFDTLLSLSVVHHFATTDRRVSALREMARVLRVGGRMIITVWAMEQDHRKFESQDVLVPWRKPTAHECNETMTAKNLPAGTKNHPINITDSDPSKTFRFRNTFKRKSRAAQHKHHRSIDSCGKSSSNSSTLSSPNETCYGFMRRALQKIAGGGKRVVANSWFLDNWITCMYRQQPLQKRYDPDGCEYCKCSGCNTLEDQPIELLRVEDEEPKPIPRRQTCPVSQMSADIFTFKSKSMNNIRIFQENNNNRFIPKTTGIDNEANNLPQNLPRNTLTRPKLVKQKKSLCDEDAQEALDQPTDMKELVRAMPEFKSGLTRYERGSVLKQRSLNEEILSTDRLREKERLKRNIQKQTSLNEDLFYKKPHTLESLRESFFAMASSKSFQMLKNGLTNRIRNSTTMERVANASIKNGFVKIFQTWKGSELKSPTNRDNEKFKNLPNCLLNDTETSEKTGERRPSKEDGSDSSKDSSLQSDTSVDSEDSFASVIFVPKSDPMSPIGGASLSAGPASPLLKGTCHSAPQSPRIKQSSCPTSPRVKQVPNGVHPLTKQLSSPKPSTGLLVVNSFFPANEKSTDSSRLSTIPKLLPESIPPSKKQDTRLFAQKYSVQPIPKFKKTSLNTPNLNDQTSIPLVPTANAVSPSDKLSPESSDASRAEKLKTIREILTQKPGFGRRSKGHCPIVRKISDPDNKDQSLAKPIPKLMKLEIFNPEEDDDSDNSCVSSPDSTGSVASVKSRNNNCSVPEKTFLFPDLKVQEKSISLLEAAANVACSLDEAVEKVIRTKAKAKLPVDVFSILHRRLSSDKTPILNEEEDAIDDTPRISSETWNEECHKHLTAFADKLSEKLMKELDEYQLTIDNIDDPYIHRLSEELHDLSVLSDEIQKQNEYLTHLSQKNHNNCQKCKKLLECICRTKSVNSSVSKSKPAISLNCNGYVNIKNDEHINGKHLDNYYALYNNTNGDQCERHKFGENIDNDDLKKKQGNSRSIIKKGSSSSESFDSSDKGSDSSNSQLSSGATSINFGGQSIASSVTDLTGDSRDSCSNGGSTASLISVDSKSKTKPSVIDRLSPGNLKRRDPSGLSDVSADSWPSEEVGGEIIYHRYYHVFRQGELEKLIEKYVEDLHVVSSTYEHASWCIIAEKVQIWTI
ncbi:uncharacterized protein LOC126741067 [Anthonomus grandis grandis]|uniref:uncharacterized protein LOC126741067 n=1 Tax=Anthonomus grandis grandis TaxID=2921223 RepID=UPI00216684AE|nr:uncharacterized protein LOC126741067 [Anthonomus grandis grandis]